MFTKPLSRNGVLFWLLYSGLLGAEDTDGKLFSGASFSFSKVRKKG
jgi:hypothetical protein